MWPTSRRKPTQSSPANTALPRFDSCSMADCRTDNYATSSTQVPSSWCSEARIALPALRSMS